MGVFMSFTFPVTSLAVAALFAGSVASAQTPTLAELAKREEARRKAVKAPTKVLTKDDVPKATVPSPAPATSQPKPAADEKGAAKPDEPVKDEAWWKGRAAKAREELRRNEMFAEALQTRINSLTSDFASRDDPYQRARIGDDRVKALAEMDRVKAEIELQKKAIADIEEEARRAGVPPGWLR
jgi:cell division septation protein DedD